MIRLANMNKTTRSSLFTYALVIVAFLIIQVLRGTVGIGSVLEGQLIPICAYVTMALALNLVVGVSGELSLGHAGFMSIGAFMGCSAASALAGVIPFAPLRLAVAMLVGAPWPVSSASSSASPCCASTATIWPLLPWPSARSSRAC